MFLVEASSAARDVLVAQATTARTEGSSCGCGCASFSLVPDRTLSAAPSAERPAVEAHGTDSGGKDVGILLWTKEGYLSEVEVFGYDDAPFAGVPAPDALRI